MASANMDFSELVRGKIEARRQAYSVAKAAADALRTQALEPIRPVHDALTAMIERLARDPIFASGFGSAPKIEFKWPAESETLPVLWVYGRVGYLRVAVSKPLSFSEEQVPGSLELVIHPDWRVAEVLGKSGNYGDAAPVQGTVDDIPGFFAAAEDMIAEFLADVAVSPVGRKFLPGAF